ncbi:MAG: DUF2442 domain-containing protein [Candidatus Aminicenantes bacterium]|nr:DUF2442 domain-containing protein [Candidatus Aminicenantes bacterium]
MVKVSDVEAKDDYVLLVTLSNGKKGLFDVKPYLDKGIFTVLKDKSLFDAVRPAFGGIVWPHQQDFSADTIEYEMKQV